MSGIEDFKLRFDVRKAERPVYTVTKDFHAIHSTVVKLNLARIRSYVDDKQIKLDYDNEEAPANQIAIRVHASVEVNKLDDLIAHLMRLRERQQQRSAEPFTVAGTEYQSTGGSENDDGKTEPGTDHMRFDDSFGAQDLGLRIIVRNLTFATRSQDEAEELRLTEQTLSKLWTRHVEPRERDEFLVSAAGALMIRMCVRLGYFLEYMIVAPHFGRLSDMLLSDLPFAMSFMATEQPLYVPHDLSIHDYLTTLSCQEFVLTSASVRRLRQLSTAGELVHVTNIDAHARNLATDMGSERQLCAMLVSGLSSMRARTMLELHPVVWLEAREETRANWQRDGEDACSVVVLKVYAWQEPPVGISAVCHKLAVRNRLTFQQIMDGKAGKQLRQLKKLTDASRALLYKFVEDELKHWTGGTVAIQRSREYVQRMMDCTRVSTARGDRFWVQCRTVDVSTSAKEVLAVVPSSRQLYRVRKPESASVEASPIPWEWPHGLSVSDIENRLRVQVTSISAHCVIIE